MASQKNSATQSDSEEASAPILRMALPVPVRGLFDYRAPGRRPATLQAGTRWRVHFSGRQMIGVLIAVSERSEVPDAKLRTAGECLDDKPLLDAQLISLLQWCADYYHHPIGEVVAAALPPRLRKGVATDSGQVRQLTITNQGRDLTPDLLKRAPRQSAILERLRGGPMLRTDLLQIEQGAAGALKALLGKGLIREREVSTARAAATVREGPTLSDAQAEAVTRIAAAQDQFAAILVDGVTGSGKTEVYLQAALRVLQAGRQVLILVPEIGLTPQLLRRIRDRLPAPVAAYHSALGASARAQAWQQMASGEAQVLVGTRSAVFAPIPKLGLIVIDEEHDGSFKQQEGFRYHARDVAVMRAARGELPIVMGSATPALETLHNVERGRYQRVVLPRRADQPPAPPLQVADLRGAGLREGLGELLLARIDSHLQAGGQVLVFLNRRGYAPVLMCHGCGWHARCQRCDAHVTVHRRPPQLRCHHCGYRSGVPLQCPDCGSDQLLHVGEGTERLEAFLGERFAGFPVLRVDRDSTRARGSFERIISEVREGQPCILVGTQMLAKGHHLPQVTLAAVVNVDQALFGSDFRSIERAAQLVIQVAGRAGRSDAVGEVVLQTHHPEHPLIAALAQHSYGDFAGAELAERQAAQLPPFAYLALLRAEAHRREDAENFLQAALRCADPLLAASRQPRLAEPQTADSLQLWGPVSAPMERRAGRYRYQLLVHASERGRLHRFVADWLPRIEALREARRARWSLDVDPQDMY